MPNPIIQNYLNDESIPRNKRENVLNDINSGKNETQIVKDLTAIYGNSYNPQSRQGPNGEMSVSEFIAQKEANPKFRIKTGRSEYRSGGINAFKSEEYLSRDKKLTNRIGNFLKGTKDAYVREAGRIDTGHEMVEGADRNKEQLEQYMQRAEEKLASGEYTQEQYDKTVEYIEPELEKFKDTRKQGSAKIFRGMASTFGAPVEGVVTGAFKPEVEVGMQYIGEKIANSENASEIVEKLVKFGEEHPALTDVFAGITELAGIKGGGKLLKKGAQSTIGAVDKASDVFQSGVKKFGPELKANLKNIKKKVPSLLEKNVEKLKNIKGPNLITKGPKNLKKAEDLLRPLPTASNLRKAATEGRAVLGEKSFLKGTKDTIELSQRMKDSASTLTKHFPRLSKETTASLPIKIQNKISEIAKPVQQTFKKVEVPQQIKKSLKESWSKLKKQQTEGVNWHSDVTKIHKKFDIILNKLTKTKLRTDGGAYRKQNLNDLWDSVKAFDKEVGNNVRNALEKAPTDSSIAKYDAWLEIRRLLRDSMDSTAKVIDDVNTKSSFKEMSDLYQASSQLLKNVKRTNASGSSVVGGITKKAARNIGAGVLGAGTYGLIAN